MTLTSEMLDVALEAMNEYHFIDDALPAEMDEADYVAANLAVAFSLTVGEAEAATNQFYDWYADALEPTDE